MSQHPLFFAYLSKRLFTRFHAPLGSNRFEGLEWMEGMWFNRLYFRLRQPLSPMQAHTLERIEP